MACDCLSHNPLIIKLNAYGFSIDSLRLVQEFAKLQTKNQNKSNIQLIGRNFIWSPQGSILGPLSLNSFLCDLFFIMDGINFASNADDNTLYTTGNDIKDAILNCKIRQKFFFNVSWITK